MTYLETIRQLLLTLQILPDLITFNNNKLNAPNSDIKKDLKRLEEEQIFSELDFKITDKEIIEGIFSLKNKKSSGMDMILNEMLKSSQLFLLKSFNKTFNLFCRQALFLHLGQIGSLFIFIKVALKMIPQIMEVLQLVMHWENYLLKYLIQD
jgi:hypothetical protein